MTHNITTDAIESLCVKILCTRFAHLTT